MLALNIIVTIAVFILFFWIVWVLMKHKKAGDLAKRGAHDLGAWGAGKVAAAEGWGRSLLGDIKKKLARGEKVSHQEIEMARRQLGVSSAELVTMVGGHQGAPSVEVARAHAAADIAKSAAAVEVAHSRAPCAPCDAANSGSFRTARPSSTAFHTARSGVSPLEM